MSLPSVEDIIASFPHPNVPKIDGEPTYKTIKEIEKILIINASSFQSELGGGAHGYLGLVVKSARYQTITGNAFNAHNNPGALPIFPASSTAPQITSISNTHREELRLWREQEAIKKALKNQLTGAFDEKYLREKNDTYTGYTNHSIQDILQYLYDRYGELDEVDIEALDEKLATPFDPTEPFGDFIKNVEDIMEVAEAAGCPYTTSQILSKCFNLINKSGALSLGCREWKRKLSTDKTWANFKTHFGKEVKDYKKDQGHTTGNTYNVANATNQELLEAQADLRTYGAKILDEVQNALRTTESAQVANATISYSDLQSQINSLKQQLKETQDQNRVLLQTIATLAGNKENVRQPKDPKEYTPWKYCWSHGANKRCDSKTCNNKKPGHIDSATFKDTKGGYKYRLHLQSVKTLLPKS